MKLQHWQFLATVGVVGELRRSTTSWSTWQDLLRSLNRLVSVTVSSRLLFPSDNQSGLSHAMKSHEQQQHQQQYKFTLIARSASGQLSRGKGKDHLTWCDCVVGKCSWYSDRAPRERSEFWFRTVSNCNSTQLSDQRWKVCSDLKRRWHNTATSFLCRYAPAFGEYLVLWSDRVAGGSTCRLLVDDGGPW